MGSPINFITSSGMPTEKDDKNKNTLEDITNQVNNVPSSDDNSNTAYSTSSYRKRSKGEKILEDDSLSKEQKQAKALEQRRKYDKSIKKDRERKEQDKERGEKRAVRENWRIDRIKNRNNISWDEAEKVYWKRQNSLGKFKKGDRKDVSFGTSTEKENAVKNDMSNKQAAQSVYNPVEAYGSRLDNILNPNPKKDSNIPGIWDGSSIIGL